MTENWIRQRYNDFQKFCCKILKSGPIPRHIALIMDGNRRYARKRGLNSVLEGHAQGFSTLSSTLEWCKELGITQVTVYAFSIENFKREKSEVDGLLDLAKQKLRKIIADKDEIEKNSVCFRFFGNLSLLPSDIRELMSHLTTLSMKNSNFVLNICFAYTSRDEISRAIETLSNGVRRGLLFETDIDSDLLKSVLDSRKSPDLDLLIRTSGENRLSDFMLYQSSYSCLYFDDVLWPDYNFWHLFRAVLYYQMHYNSIKKIADECIIDRFKAATDDKILRIKHFLCVFEEENRRKE